jgi:hypothetical protein
MGKKLKKFEHWAVETGEKDVKKFGHWASEIGIHNFRIVTSSIPETIRARSPHQAKRLAMQYLVVAKVKRNEVI